MRSAPQARAAAGRWAKLFELSFFPSRCKTCGGLLEGTGERILCRACLGEIVASRLPECPRCGRFFEGAGGPHVCGECVKNPPAFLVHRSCGAYRGRLKDAILLFKFRKCRPLGGALARFIHETKTKEEALWNGADLIMPVPLHRRRERERGFNQSAVLAREIGRLRGIPVEARVLRKVRNAPPQTSLERAGRLTNVREAYRVVRPERVRQRTVLLVDDVYTTGATIRECAAVLVEA